MAMVMIPGFGQAEPRPAGELVLREGAYLVETVFPRLASVETCERAYRLMGWEDVIVDESPRTAESTFSRFVGRVPTAKLLHLSSVYLEWAYVRQLPFDPYSHIHKDSFPPFKLLNGQTSAVRFISRLGHRDMRGPSIARDVVEKLLGKIGFETHKLSLLRQNMRLPDRPGAGQALWIGVVTWRKPDSLLTINDPLCFEDMTPLEGAV